MKKLGDGRGKTIVSPSTRQIADGEITDFSDWSVKELFRGQRKNKRGNWTGKRPKLLPAQLVQEVAGSTMLFRALGPVALGGRGLPDRVMRVIGLLAPTLLAALVITQSMGGTAGWCWTPG